MGKTTGFLLLVTLGVLQISARAADLPDHGAGGAKDEAAAVATPEPTPGVPAKFPAKGSHENRVEIGVGVKVSTLGIGGEAAVPVSHRTNVRVGFNAFSYGDTFTKDGVTYKGTLTLRSLQATYDLFLIGGLHLSPGVLVYNGNKVTANAAADKPLR